MNDTIALLKRRRSSPPAIMTGPGPTKEELTTILTIASRVPDHGKLAPWRFVVFEGQARDRVGRIALDLRLEDKPDLDEAARTEELRRFARAPLVVGVVSRAAPACQDTRMGAGPLFRRGLHEPDRRRARARLFRDLAHRMARLRRRASARRSASPNTRKSPGSSISAGRTRSRTARVRRSPRSSRPFRSDAPMFYETAKRDRAKLPHDPFKAIVAPRPIGWISTRARRRAGQSRPLQFLQRLLQLAPHRRLLQ